MTLAEAAFGRQTLVKQIALVLGGSLLIALAAQVSVPMFPVPMTLQTLAILIVGLCYGARLGAVTLLVYLAEGAMGLPVFANAGNGAAFFGPTAGFLVGFVFMAWFVGYAADRGWTRSAGGAAVFSLIAAALIYVPGLAWPMSLANLFGFNGTWVGQDFVGYYWAYFAKPFLFGDAVKAAIAAIIVVGTTQALKFDPDK